MYISLQWLKEYVSIPGHITPEQLAQDLTLHTVEVEEVAQKGILAKGLIVGKIESCTQHPNADKLSIAQVSDGKNTHQVVCGGSNVKEGMLIVFAPVKATVLWGGKEETLEPVKLRGEESNGMICAGVEFGYPELDQGEKEIIDLEKLGCTEEEVGTAVYKALSKRNLLDTVIEVDNKSMTHRADLWGHYGIAREIAAIYKTELRPVEELLHEIEQQEVAEKIEAIIDENTEAKTINFCKLSNIAVKPSSQEIQRKLTAVGLTPINNIVDITNIVMFELGQPTHAFDANKLQQKNLQVRRAEAEEKIETLDHQEVKLTEEDVVIAEQDGKAISIAGVIGGQETGITETTTSIILESACFDPVRTRKTAQRHNIKTDAAMRFEKAPNPQQQPLQGMLRLMQLIKQECPEATLQTEIKTVVQEQYIQEPATIKVETSWLQKRIGKEIPQEEIIQILKNLTFDVKEEGETLTVSAPIYRTRRDIKQKEDILEEVARMYGYQNIEPVAIKTAIQPAKRNKIRQQEWALRDLLKGQGWTEVLLSSFIGDKDLEHMQEKQPERYIKMKNSLSSEETLLRRSLLTGMLQIAHKNRKESEELAIFEIGKVYKKEEQGYSKGNPKEEYLPREEMYLGIMATGEKALEKVQATVEKIQRQQGWKMNIVQGEPQEWAHPAKQGVFQKEDETAVGAIAEVHPAIAASVTKKTVAYAEILLSHEQELVNKRQKRTYQHPSKYPSVKFDFSLTLPKSVIWKELHATIKGSHSLIKSVDFFDEYQKNPQADTKNIGFHVMVQSQKRTLPEEKVREVRQAILDKVIEKHDGVCKVEVSHGAQKKI